MSDEIIKILDDLGERFGLAIDWTSENVIPQLEMLYNKFVNYSIAINVGDVVIGIVLIILTNKMLKYLIKCYKKCNDTHEDNLLVERCCGNQLTVMGLFYMLATVGVGICGGLEIIWGVSNLIELLTIPELYVFEYLKPYVLGA